MSDEEDAHPILKAHAAAFKHAGREAADAVLVKFGGRKGPGGYRSVPESKQAACIAELERLAAGPATNEDAVQSGLKRLVPLAMANFGNEKPAAPRAPRSLAELQKQAMDRFNATPKARKLAKK